MAHSRTTYILDTSVLLSAGKKALTDAYPNSDVVIPLAVVVELEKKKDDPLLGFVARSVLKKIEKLRSDKENSIDKGVLLENGIAVRVETNHISDKSDIPESVRRRSDNDFLIMTVARNLQKEGKQVVLVSNDLSMRILASVALGIASEEYRVESSQGAYEGVYEAHCSKEAMDKFYAEGNLSSDEVEFNKQPNGKNYGVILRSSANGGALAIEKEGNLVSLKGKKPTAFEMTPRSPRQVFALKHLLDDDLPVISLGGPAGTGKTLLALAAGLQKTLEDKKYKKVVVFRPVTAVGNENLGYLPGTEEEKMMPWAGAIYDALEAITDSKEVLAEIEARGLLEILPVTHIRGRTFTNAFVIIDEAQNLERNTLLSVLSRAGTDTKTIFSWDAAQKDNLHIGKHDGIVAIVDRLRLEPEFAHVTLDKSERSKVAQMASKILEEF